MLRDTGATQSLILDSQLLFSEESYTGTSVFVRGVGQSGLEVPLHSVWLTSELWTACEGYQCNFGERPWQVARCSLLWLQWVTLTCVLQDLRLPAPPLQFLLITSLVLKPSNWWILLTFQTPLFLHMILLNVKSWLNLSWTLPLFLFVLQVEENHVVVGRDQVAAVQFSEMDLPFAYRLQVLKLALMYLLLPALFYLFLVEVNIIGVGALLLYEHVAAVDHLREHSIFALSWPPIGRSPFKRCPEMSLDVSQNKLCDVKMDCSVEDCARTLVQTNKFESCLLHCFGGKCQCHYPPPISFGWPVRLEVKCGCCLTLLAFIKKIQWYL